jgi:sporulation protein YlmC with PRC-barrel domain
MHRRRVLVPLRGVSFVDWDHRLIELGMKCEHLHKLPQVTGRMEPRRDGVAHEKYYKWPYFWTGAGTFGIEGFPSPASVAPSDDFINDVVRLENGSAQAEIDESLRVRLRSFNEIQGYKIHATNGIFGTLEDLIVDAKTWAIEYFLVNSRHWWISKLAKLEPKDIEEISWDREEVFVNEAKEKIIGASYDESNLSL